MQAFRLTRWKTPGQLQEIPEPEPGPGQIAVRILPQTAKQSHTSDQDQNQRRRNLPSQCVPQFRPPTQSKDHHATRQCRQ